MSSPLRAGGLCHGVPLSFSWDGASLTLTLGEGASAQHERRAAEALHCQVGAAQVSGLVWLAGLAAVFPASWFAVAEAFDGWSVVAGGVLAALLATAAWAASKTRWPVVIATRSEFVAFDCGWRDVSGVRRLERALAASRLSRAWAGRSVFNPRAIWTELKLALAPGDALLDAQYEREQSPMRRADYRQWRPRHALAVTFFGLVLPALVAGAYLATRDTLAVEHWLGAAFLAVFLLVPVGLTLAQLVRRALLSVDGVPDQATLRPMFRVQVPSPP